MFDIGTGELIALAALALLIFGPDRLPKIAAEAGRMVRQLRQMAAAARRDLSDQLGPEFKDLDLHDLDPRTLARKHLFDDDLDLGLDDEPGPHGGSLNGGEPLRAGERPPYDPEAT